MTDCKVVRWNNCILVARDEPEWVPKVDCQKNEEIKMDYKTCKTSNKEIMTRQQTCEVKAVQSCEPKVVKKVIRSTWKSFHELIQKTI